MVAAVVATWTRDQNTAVAQHSDDGKKGFSMFRYRLRTLIWLTVLGPPVLAVAWLWGVPAFMLLFWPKTPNEDMVAAIAKSVVCAIAAIGFWTWSFYLRPMLKDRS